MVWIIIGLVVLFMIIRMKPAKGIEQISTSELKNMINQKNANQLLIDVRTPAEYKGRHIKQFKNMPLGTNFSTLDHSKEVIVICQSGMRSMQACKQLKKQGFTSIKNVRGGMNAWN